MTLYEFNLLELKYKIGVTLNQATFLDNYINDDVRINIYALDLFFIELIYDANFSQITEVRSFKHVRHLDKYSADLDKFISTCWKPRINAEIYFRLVNV